jgi:hypothetical protein
VGAEEKGLEAEDGSPLSQQYSNKFPEVRFERLPPIVIAFSGWRQML